MLQRGPGQELVSECFYAIDVISANRWKVFRRLYVGSGSVRHGNRAPSVHIIWLDSRP